MATIRISDAWRATVMETLLNGGTGPPEFKFHAYENDLTPTPASVLVDFTECTITGYAAETVDNSGWGNSGSSTGITIYANAPFIWALEEAGIVYGYYVTDAGNSVLMWSQRFDSPLVFGVLGGTITIVPKLQFNSPIV